MGKPKARHKRFVQTLLTTRMHIIVCLRAKEKLLQQGGDIVSGGWVPVQEKFFGYEMTVRLSFPEGGKPGVPELIKCPADLLGRLHARRTGFPRRRRPHRRMGQGRRSGRSGSRGPEARCRGSGRGRRGGAGRLSFCA
jgi:hypothetical protein